MLSSSLSLLQFPRVLFHQGEEVHYVNLQLPAGEEQTDWWVGRTRILLKSVQSAKLSQPKSLSILINFSESDQGQVLWDVRYNTDSGPPTESLEMGPGSDFYELHVVCDQRHTSRGNLEKNCNAGELARTPAMRTTCSPAHLYSSCYCQPHPGSPKQGFSSIFLT